MAEKRGTVGGDHGGERVLKMQRQGEGGADKEKKRRGILYFQSHFYFYKVDLDQFDGIDDEAKLLAPAVNFLESGQFIGMGLCKIGERVFVFGGQQANSDALRPPAERTSSIGDLQYNAGVKEFIPHKDKFVDQNLIPNMEASKARPLVVCYGEKIFVHDRCPANYGLRYPRLRSGSSFERLFLSSSSSSSCSSSRRWVKLVTPLRLMMARCTGLFTSVVRERLFLADNEEILCFNLRTENWEPDPWSSIIKTCNANSLLMPIGGTCVKELPSGANILLSVSPDNEFVRAQLCSEYGSDEGEAHRLHAYVLDEASGGRLLAFQSLPQFDRFVRPLLYHSARPIFLHLGDGSMCGLFFGSDRVSWQGHYLNICIFSMEILVPDGAVDIWRKNPLLNCGRETKILQCKILHSQFFELEGIEERYNLLGHETHNAFLA